MPIPRRSILIWTFGLCAFFGLLPRAHSQAALLMEEPYGFFGTLNPTGHNALYFARICAETPVKLRRCGPGELGSVIARYQGIAHYDWVAMPLIPYLYSVEQIADVPTHVNHETVTELRNFYHEEHLGALGAKVFEGSFTHGGWNQLIGVAYERRIYAFRFDTTAEQDDALIDQLNDSKNKSKFSLTYNNCADFARKLLNQYFPETFKRTVFPDAGMATPRQIAYKLVKYSKKHPETELMIYEIPQVPGYRRPSHPNKSIAASLVTTGYIVPIVLLNPYLAGGIFVDYLVRGRYPVIEGHPHSLTPDQLSVLASLPKAPLGPSVPSSVASTMTAGQSVTAQSAQTVPTATAVAVKTTIGVHD
jgi:hypothetical protein